MKLIVCLDDKNGMSFNGRRQSRDRAVCDRIIALACGSVLWMNAYSRKLFEHRQVNIRSADNFLECAAAGELCFVENEDVNPCFDLVEEIYIFRWNRSYPSDMRFPAEVVKKDFKRKETMEFEGHSHPVITLEVYTR